MPKLKTARFMYINSSAEFDCNALIEQLKNVDFRDGSLECHSNANIGDKGNSSEGEESIVADDSSFWASLGNLASQFVLDVRRFVF